MPLYQIRYEQSAWAPPFALLRWRAVVADAVLTFASIILPMVAMDSSPWLVENWLSYDWPLYLAFMLGLLTLAGIVVAAAITTSWHD
jgi:hypothetical protein